MKVENAPLLARRGCGGARSLAAMTFNRSRFQRVMVWLGISVSFACALSAQVTEVPQTVAPGKFLLEMDGIRLSVDRVDAAGYRYDGLGLATTLVSTGLTRNIDVQAGFQLFHRETVEFGGTRDSDSGLGDLSLRLKWKFWEDVEFGAAAAVIPYVKVPTESTVGNNAVEGGFIVPWAMHLNEGTVAGAMFRWDMVRNPAGNGYDSRWAVTGYAERQLLLGIKAYAEAILEASSSGGSDSAGMVGVGARWQLGDMVELDYELLKGLNARASEWTHVLRVNWGW